MTDETPSGLSRRSMLKLAAGTAAGVALAGQAQAQPENLPTIPDEATGRPFPEAELQMPLPPGERLGWCVVGLGSFALNQVIPAIARSQTARLTALVSGNADKAARVAEHYGVPDAAIYDYENFDEIADNDDIDVVYIVLPNGLHAEYTIRAFEAGKHVMCEKPMANTVEECRQMIAASERADKKLMIAYRAHFEPHNERALQMKEDGEFGDVKMVLASTMRTLDLSRPRDEWRVLRDLAGGGSTMDIGIYALNGALYFLGETPTALVASIANPPDDVRFREVEDMLTAQLTFPSGALVNLASAYTLNENRIQLLGTEGTGLLDPATSYSGNELRQTGPDVGTRIVPVSEPAARQFTGEIDHLSRAVMEDFEPRTPGAMGLRDVGLIMAMYASAERNAWVTLNPDGTMAEG
ncbi:Gfo/Idh/MocA family oxidoreductase [Aurantimonas aggregata]|uniref:Gfo/Idh/MocA family oxidoreductase n=1 Tax=Aurantimonas aggregata TaxID=2047720 RepID=A0A6L9MKC1_9HYPH|nr:Gfo/Idh/MocA family oxidoreductase [Aurantimonas aggregata]NDV88283.1 Gfo/Idh/MocA family oxidoreductase [Aurantimonas aggregata]